MSNADAVLITITITHKLTLWGLFLILHLGRRRKKKIIGINANQICVISRNHRPSISPLCYLPVKKCRHKDQFLRKARAGEVKIEHFSSFYFVVFSIT